MKRCLPLVLLALCAGAMADEDLPTPPIPPDAVPLAATAPVPNPDARLPASASSAEPDVNIRLYRSNSANPSAGFTPGSQFQTSEDRKPIQTPGLSVSVPIK
jgi:hypothetical protein